MKQNPEFKLVPISELKPNPEVSYYSEMSYRRGVAQALSMIGDELRHFGHDEAADIADNACDLAMTMRYSREQHDMYLDVLADRLRNLKATGGRDDSEEDDEY